MGKKRETQESSPVQAGPPANSARPPGIAGVQGDWAELETWHRPRGCSRLPLRPSPQTTKRRFGRHLFNTRVTVPCPVLSPPFLEHAWMGGCKEILGMAFACVGWCLFRLLVRAWMAGVRGAGTCSVSGGFVTVSYAWLRHQAQQAGKAVEAQGECTSGLNPQSIPSPSPPQPPTTSIITTARAVSMIHPPHLHHLPPPSPHSLALAPNPAFALRRALNPFQAAPWNATLRNPPYQTPITCPPCLAWNQLDGRAGGPATRWTAAIRPIAGGGVRGGNYGFHGWAF